MSDGTVEGMRKKRGWLWWLGVLVVLGILSDDDDDNRRCSVGDEAFLRAIGQAVGEWKIEDFALYPTDFTSSPIDQAGTVKFSASVAADNGWNGTALGSVRLRGCKANVEKVQ